MGSAPSSSSYEEVDIGNDGRRVGSNSKSSVHIHRESSLVRSSRLTRIPPPQLAISCSSFIVIKWNPPSKAGYNFQYQVQMSTSRQSLNWIDVPTDSSKASRPSAYIKDIRKGDQHVFRVRYRQRRLRSKKTRKGIIPEWGPFSEFSPWSAPSAFFSAQATCPSKPLPPTVHEVGTTAVKFAWQAPSSSNGDDVSEYELRVLNASDLKDTHVIYTGPKLSCTCALKTLAFLKCEEKYLVTIAARNSVGQSQFSDASSFIIKSIPKIKAAAKRETKRAEPEPVASCSRAPQQVDRRKSFRHLGLASPVYVSTLSDGWREYYDPASDNFYYSDPGGQVVQWERPAQKGVSNTFINLPDPHASFTRKRFQFLWHLRKTASAKNGTTAVKIIKLRLRRNKAYFFDDCLREFSRITTEQLKTSSLRVEYIGEKGIDSGGIANDFFLEASKAAFSTSACLFRFQPDSERCSIDPRSEVAHGDSCPSVFRFIGRMLAKSIYDRRLTAARLSSSLLKALVGQKPDLSDLSEIDHAYARSLSWMLSATGEELEVLDLRWVADVEIFGKRSERPLILGGEARRVTRENRKEFVDLMVEFKTTTVVEKQLAAFVSAFHEIIPRYAIEVFSVPEMDLLLNGKSEIIVDELRASCVLKGDLRSDARSVRFFWSALDSCSDKQKAAVLRFWTGTSRVPLDGYDPPINIAPLCDGDGSFLPRGRTCFNVSFFSFYFIVSV